MSKLSRISKKLPPRLPDAPNNIVITKADVGRRIVYVDKERHREGLLVGWNGRHASVRFPEGQSMHFEPRFLRFKDELWMPELANFIVLFVGLWQMNRMRYSSMTLDITPEDLVVNIAADREMADQIVQYLIGRLTPRRLALPDGYDKRSVA